MNKYDPISEFIEALVLKVIEAAIRVHKQLGPGLLESVYVKCLVRALRKMGLKVKTEVTLPVKYDDLTIDEGYRLDLLVEDELIVECKAVEELHPVHKVQFLTYMKLAGKRLALLLNFNLPLMKGGIHRIIR